MRLIVPMLVGGATIIAVMLAYHGAFSRVTVTEASVGPLEFVYRTGPSGNFRAVRRVTTELEALLSDAGVTNIQPLDIYYPPGGPDTEIGFVVPRESLARIASMPNAPQHRTLAPSRMTTTRFPYRSPFSFMVGAVKIGQALEKYRAEKGYANTWAATINEGRTILYFQPVPEQTR